VLSVPTLVKDPGANSLSPDQHRHIFICNCSCKPDCIEIFVFVCSNHRDPAPRVNSLQKLCFTAMALNGVAPVQLADRWCFTITG
ncbi:uncharacterized protein METZ01_LOCUS371220, partial [marine metagenome]